MRRQAQKLSPRRDLKTLFLSQETTGFFRQMTVRGLIFPFFFVLLEAMVLKKKKKSPEIRPNVKLAFM